MNYEPLNRALASAIVPVYATSFQEVAAGFKDKYSARTWTSELAQRIAGTSDKGAKEYKAALRNVQRYEKGTHNPDRAKAPIKQAIASAGRTLDPIRKDAPKEGLTFVLTFQAPGDKGHAPRGRETPSSGPDVIHLDYGTAVQYINQDQPTYDFLFDEWFDGGGETYGEDGDYEVDVTGVVCY